MIWVIGAGINYGHERVDVVFADLNQIRVKDGSLGGEVEYRVDVIGHIFGDVGGFLAVLAVYAYDLYAALLEGERERTADKSLAAGDYYFHF